MHRTELRVTWSVESWDDGRWALFAYVGEQQTQCSAWYDSREALMAAIAAMFTAPEPE